MTKLKFTDDGVEIYDLTPASIGAVSAADLAALIETIATLQTRIATLEARKVLLNEYPVTFKYTSP